MLDKVRQFFREFWRAAGLWGVAWLVWIALSCSVRLSVIELHAKLPGGYNAPEKVAVRKTLIAAGGLGQLVCLVGFFAQSERRKLAEQARQTGGQQSDA